MGVNKAMKQERQPKTSANGKGKAPEGKGFVNCPLTQQDKDNVKRAASDAEKLIDTISELCGHGYKFSLGASPSTTSFVASMTDRDSTSQHYMFTLTSHAPDPILALAGVIYKHVVLLAESWPEQGAIDDGWS